MNGFSYSALALALASASCGGGPLGTLERALADPTIERPIVRSFAVENRVDVAWPADPGADEYVLESAPGDRADPGYRVVYRGRSTSYAESDCVDQSLRLFRLTKTRGNRDFGPSEAALGVGSATTRDAEEPNDDESRATELGYEKRANLYHYRSWGGIVVEDEDWYSIRVPPRMTANVVVVQVDPEVSARAATWMYFYRPGQLPVPVINDSPIALANLAYEERRIAFKIFPHAEDFHGLGVAGGSIVDYSLKLVSISNL